MQRELSFEYSHRLVGRGTRRFLSRHLSGRILATAILFAVVIWAVASGTMPVSWWLIVLLLPLLFAAQWYRYYRAALEVCDSMPDRNVTFRVEPESATFQSSDHTTTMKWSRVREIWRFPEVLLLFTYNRQTHSILPTAPLGEDVIQFIEDRVRAHGGKVT